MNQTEVAVRQRARWGRRFLIVGAILIGLLLTWHLYLSLGLSNRVRSLQSSEDNSAGEVAVSVNPVTNLVSLTIALPPSELGENNPLAALGASLGQAMIKAMGPGLIERELNTRARERYDLYSLVVPYRVSISTEPASPEAVARMRDQLKKRQEKEAQAKAAAEAQRLKRLRAYISANLALEKVKVAPGVRFGQKVEGVFGTIVNKGKKSLSQVTVRVYFLDRAGQRIGEKDYMPVLVSEFSFGDNTPLRPGYRRDFGYDVEDAAPSGWSKRIEAEIVDIKFLDKQ